MTTIRSEPNKDLLRVLTALGIQWDLSLSGNGDGNWALIELDDETYRQLGDVWERLTDLRYGYVHHCQGSHGIQLGLPIDFK